MLAGGVHLVELSQAMRGMQSAALGCDDATSGDSKVRLTTLHNEFEHLLLLN